MVNAPWVMQCFCNRNTCVLPKVGAPYYEGGQVTCNIEEDKTMSKEKSKICLESALSEFELYESLGIRDYLKSAYDNMVKALKELED